MRDGRFYKVLGVHHGEPHRNPRWEHLAEHWGQDMLFRGQSLKKTP